MLQNLEAFTNQLTQAPVEVVVGKVEADVVMAAVRELAASGFVTESADSVALTAAGRQRHGQIRDRLTEVTGRLFGDFSAADLETAGRVLAIITERANAELAR